MGVQRLKWRLQRHNFNEIGDFSNQHVQCQQKKWGRHQQHWWELNDEEVPNQTTHHGRTSKRVSFSKPTAGHHSDAMIKIPRTFGAPKWINHNKSDPKPELPYWAFYMCKGSHKWSPPGLGEAQQLVHSVLQRSDFFEAMESYHWLLLVGEKNHLQSSRLSLTKRFFLESRIVPVYTPTLWQVGVSLPQFLLVHSSVTW